MMGQSDLRFGRSNFREGGRSAAITFTAEVLSIMVKMASPLASTCTGTDLKVPATSKPGIRLGTRRRPDRFLFMAAYGADIRHADPGSSSIIKPRKQRRDCDSGVCALESAPEDFVVCEQRAPDIGGRSATRNVIDDVIQFLSPSAAVDGGLSIVSVNEGVSDE